MNTSTRFYASTHKDGRHLVWRVVTDYSARSTFTGMGVEVERVAIGSPFPTLKHARHAAARLNHRPKTPWLHDFAKLTAWMDRVQAA